MEHPTTTRTGYPLRLTIDYPDRELNRLTSGLRVFTVIPIAIVLCSLMASGMGLLFIPPALMIVGRRKYPAWWLEFNVQLLAFMDRVAAYAMLMTDTYPSTDDEQFVRLEIDRPDAARDLDRWLPLVKWFLVLPHIVALVLLSLGAMFAAIGAWFTILFTGRYPRGLFDYIEGVVRWHNRVVAYAFILVTDEYPPFSLS